MHTDFDLSLLISSHIISLRYNRFMYGKFKSTVWYYAMYRSRFALVRPYFMPDIYEYPANPLQADNYT